MGCEEVVLEWDALEFAVGDLELAESVVPDRPPGTRRGAFAGPYEAGEQECDADRAAAPQTPKGMQRPRDESDEVESDVSDDEDDGLDEDVDLDDDEEDLDDEDSGDDFDADDDETDEEEDG